MTDAVPAKMSTDDLAGRLRDRIRDSLGDLIPDAQWTEMMKAETERFLNPRPSSGYRQNKLPSDFSTIVQEEFGAWVRTKVKAHLNSPAWKETWDTEGRPVLPEKFKGLLVEQMPAMLREVVVGMLSGTFQAAKAAALHEMEVRDP